MDFAPMFACKKKFATCFVKGYAIYDLILF